MPVHLKAVVKADDIRDKQVVRSKHDRTSPPGASALETLILQKLQKILLILFAKFAKRLYKDEIRHAQPYSTQFQHTTYTFQIEIQ
jgi:hypothetical protein